MKLHVNVTIDDLVAFQRYHHAQSPKLRQGRRTMFIIVAAGMIAISGAAAWGLESSLPLIIGLIALPIYVVIMRTSGESTYLNMLENQAREMFSEGGNLVLFGLHECEITDDAFIERSAYHEYATRWTAVEKVVETLTHVFVYYCGAAAYVAPKHGLDQDEVRRFVAEAQRLHAASATGAAQVGFQKEK